MVQDPVTVKALWPLTVAFAYLVASTPIGLWVGKWTHGVDLREEGNRDLGAHNAQRVLGWGPALAIGLLDFMKGLALPLVGWQLLGQTKEAVMVIAIVTVFGNIWPLLANFRGAKGFETSLGGIAALSLLGPDVLLLPKIAFGWFLYWLFFRKHEGGVAKATVIATFLVPAFLLTGGWGRFGLISGSIWGLLILIANWQVIFPPEVKEEEVGPQLSRRERRLAERAEERRKEQERRAKQQAEEAAKAAKAQEKKKRFWFRKGGAS